MSFTSFKNGFRKKSIKFGLKKLTNKTNKIWKTKEKGDKKG